MTANPHVEILAVRGSEFLRYDWTVVLEETDDLAEAVLAKATAMREVYNDSTGLRLGMFHLTDGTVEICTATGQKETFAL